VDDQSAAERSRAHQTQRTVAAGVVGVEQVAVLSGCPPELDPTQRVVESTPEGHGNVESGQLITQCWAGDEAVEVGVAGGLFPCQQHELALAPAVIPRGVHMEDTG
jgi:hypothetical protein